MQTEVQQMQQQAPSVKIILDYDKKDPNIYQIKPTRESVKALAEWYKANGIPADMRVSVSGTEIGTRELPPLFSQEVDFDEEAFRKWAFEIMGPGAIAEIPEPELPILRKIYGNYHIIEAMRNEKRTNDVKKWTITALTRFELDNKLKDVLDDRFGNPLEFKEDIDVLNTRIKDQKEYGYLGDEAIDYMFGCILEAHILGQGKKITVKNNQPTVETGNPAENAQWKWIFETIHFGEKEGQSKIADYIAAHAYHNENKDLTGYYGDLSQKIVGTSPDIKITAERIEQSGLSPSEKSFMSLWLDKDVRLWDIETRQRDYVERAKENMKGKSPETLKRDFHRDAIWTLAKVSPMLGAGVLVGLFWGLLAMIWGMDNKLAKFVLTIAAGLWVVGVATAAPWVLRDFQKNALDNGNAITQAPRRTQNTGDALSDAANEMPEFFKDKWNNVTAFFSTSDDWSQLMLDDRIGPKLVDKYPTGAILAVLNPDPDNEFNEKWKWTPTQEAEIEKILEKLDGDEREKLNTMLRETWDKYKNAHKGTLNNAQLKNGTIKDMIESLDTEYSWLYARRISYLFDDNTKQDMLIEFTKNPTGWKNAKIGDLMAEWFSSTREDLPVWRIVPNSIKNLVASVDTLPLKSMKINIQKIWEANAPCDPEKTLGELLAKED